MHKDICHCVLYYTIVQSEIEAKHSLRKRYIAIV